MVFRIDGKDEMGPLRILKSEADADLRSTRNAGTKNGMVDQLKFLKRQAALQRSEREAANARSHANVEDVEISFGRSVWFRQRIDI